MVLWMLKHPERYSDLLSTTRVCLCFNKPTPYSSRRGTLQEEHLAYEKLYSLANIISLVFTTHHQNAAHLK